MNNNIFNLDFINIDPNKAKSFDLQNIDLDHLNLLKFKGDFEKSQDILGEGRFGKVYLVTHEETGNKYALKIMDKDTMTDPINYSNYINEINVLSKFHYPTLLHLSGFYECKDIYMMFTEYIKNGTLETFFYIEDKYKKLDENKKFIIILLDMELH